MLGQLLESLSGHWAVHLESRFPRTELYEARIASSKPSLGFFILLISSAVIATLADFQQHGSCDRGHDRRPANGSHPQPGLWFGGQ